MRNRWRVGGIIALLLCAVASAVRADSSDLPWHLAAWRYRQVVSLVFSDREGRINTGLIQLAERPSRVAPDGRDIRVLDEQGRPVPIQLVNAAREPATGASEEGPYLIQFKIEDPAVSRYIVYYGNPEAAAAFSAWDKRLGGLKLATYSNEGQRFAIDLRDMLAMISGGVKFGEGARREINDPENPFGPNEYYLSLYDGLIYCPVDGEYLFATDSDDSSFLLVDDALVVQWPGGHSPAGGFQPAHSRSLSLKTGIHRILYYHVQAGGGSLAHAGWRVPGCPDVVTIPETAFVRELMTEPLQREDREDPVSAFFTTEPARTVQFGRSGPVFATIGFLDRSRSCFGPLAVREWEFGDGTVSREENPVHLFAGGRAYQVTLRVTDRLGFESTASREVKVASEVADRLDVDMELVLDPAVLLSQDAPAAQVRCRVSGVAPVPMELVMELKLPDGTTLRKEREPVMLAGGEWLSLERTLSPQDAAAFGAGEMLFHLAHEGVPVLSRTVRIVNAAEQGLRLMAAGDKLADENGNLVVLRLSEETPGKSEWSLEARLRDKPRIRLAVIDDSIAGPVRGYPEAVAEELRKRLQKEEVELRCFGAEETGGAYDLQRHLTNLPDQVAAFAPDVVVVAASLRDVLRFTPVDRFERNLQALVERVRGATGAQVVLLAAPPVLGNPGLSQAYAIAAKRVGMREKLPVADAFSAFVRAGETDGVTGRAGWQEFYRDNDGAPLYHMAPTQRGQDLIAQTLARTLCQRTSVGFERGN